MATFREIEDIINRYDAATTGLDQAVTDRISRSIDAAYRNLDRELRRQYPNWQSQGSLYASQRRLLLMQELGPLLEVINPAQRAEYERLFAETLQTAHTSGATLADELTRTIDPGYPLQDFTTIPIEAAVAQARDGVNRLYRYNDDFRTAASSIVEQGLIQGWGTGRVASLMQRELGVTKSKAETIARTEVMSAFNTATKERYEQNGITEGQWLAVQSERLCPTCAARHGNVYKLTEISVPAHPRCRCTIVGWKKEWAAQGLTDDAAINASKDAIVAEFTGRGGKLDNGPTAWERKAGLTAAPKPVWKPGDKVAVVATSPGFVVTDLSRQTIDEPAINLSAEQRKQRPNARTYTDKYVFSVTGGNLDGSDTVVEMIVDGSAWGPKGRVLRELEVNFTVNGEYRTTNTRPEVGSVISNKIGELFRTNLQEQPDGTRFFTTAAEGDSRAGFREAMYAKVGFSFAEGESRPGGFGEQYGIVKGGRLVPADDGYTPFSKAKQEEHRQAIRQAIRDAIKDARQGSFR